MSVNSLVHQKRMMDELMETLCQEITREIDRHILEEIHYAKIHETLRLRGWHVVLHDDLKNETQEWMTAHCLGNFNVYRKEILFELQEDAVLFQMVWS
jgi:hypothetical protein